MSKNNSGQYEDLNLMNVGGGVLPELFDYELKKVLKNLADPNVSSNKTREISITVKMSPSKDLSTLETDILITSKLAPFKGHPATIHLAQQGTAIRAFHHDPSQGDFFEGVEPIDGTQKEA